MVTAIQQELFPEANYPLAVELLTSAVSLLGQDGPEDGAHALDKLALHYGCEATPPELKTLCGLVLELFSGVSADEYISYSGLEQANA